jgi:hypothetical protein
MNKETIDAAILAHRGWVSRFKTAFRGINTEYFELSKTVDPDACDLGKWLHVARSHHQLNQETHDRLQDLHVRFHKLCGVLAVQLNQRSAGHTYQAEIDELDVISKSIVQLLLHTRGPSE